MKFGTTAKREAALSERPPGTAQPRLRVVLGANRLLPLIITNFERFVFSTGLKHSVFLLCPCNQAGGSGSPVALP